MKISNALKNLGLLSLTLLVAALVRLAPLLKGTPLAAYGYDYGLYLHALKQVKTFQFSDLLSAIKGTYESLLFFLINPQRLGAETTLDVLQFTASMLLPLAFYFYFHRQNGAPRLPAVVPPYPPSPPKADTAGLSAWGVARNPPKPKLWFILTCFTRTAFIRSDVTSERYSAEADKTAAIFASLLAAVSIIQTETYLMFLLKTVLALPLLLLAFKFLEEKRYPWFILAGLAVFVTHRTTSIVLTATLLLYFSFKLIKNPRLIPIASALGLLLLGGWLWGPKIYRSVQALFAYPNPNRIIGIFLENENLFEILWPVAILAAAGFIFSLRAQKHSIFAVLTSLCLLWIILGLPFYRRMFIYLDLGLTFYAAYFLGLLNYKNRLAKIILLVFLAAVGFNLVNFVFQKTPILNGAEIEEIKNLGLKQEGTILSLSSDDAPWLLGFLPSAATVFAPGMFADPHSYEDWVAFWAGQNQEQFLKVYNPPLYLYSRSLPGLKNTIPCLQKLTENFSLYRCEEPYPYP